jgi:hypothetical protein
MNRCLHTVLVLAASAGFKAFSTSASRVGGDFCPWWGADQSGHGFDWNLRTHATPNERLLAIGYQHGSRGESMVLAQVDQSLLGNIFMWWMSRWGSNK